MVKKSTLAFIVVYLCIFGIAVAFRVTQLDLRPMHGDEANQAIKAGILLEKGEYTYDPHEHHGPTLYYGVLPLFWLTGAKTIAEVQPHTLRALPVIFSLILLLLVLLLRRSLGNVATLFAALFTALSPAMVYYSRYFIQEMLFITFIFAVFVCAWRYVQTQRLRWLLLSGAALGLVHATKETCLVVFFCMAASLCATWVYARIRDGRFPIPLQKPSLRPYLLALLTAFAVSAVLYASFFTHPRGILDSFLTYTTYFTRSEGAGSTAMHNKPFYYYLSLLAYTYRSAGPRWTEGLILFLALFGIFPPLVRRIPQTESSPETLHLLRFLAFYTLFTTLLFSLIPYKTPWNLLVFWQPMLLMAGVGAAWLIHVGRWWPVKALLLILMLAATAHLARLSYLTNFRYPADVRNPYVYAHTSTAFKRLVQRINDIADIAPQHHALHINILKPDRDYWPLPWYLRSYTQAGYWQQFPEVPDAAIIIADPRLRVKLHDTLKQEYHIEFHALRPGVLLHTYIRKDLWDQFIASRS